MIVNIGLGTLLLGDGNDRVRRVRCRERRQPYAHVLHARPGLSNYTNRMHPSCKNMKMTMTHEKQTGFSAGGLQRVILNKLLADP